MHFRSVSVIQRLSIVLDFILRMDSVGLCFREMIVIRRWFVHH